LRPEVGHIAEQDLTGVAVGDPPADLQGVPGLGEGVAGLGDERLADRGQLHPPTGPLEQGAAELPLQPLDLLADRLLCDMQPRGRTAEVQLVGDRDGVLQLTQLHTAPPGQAT
jgi:hypothetical protein